MQPLAARPAPVPPDVLDRLRRWVRTTLGLGADETVLVSQLRCRDAGCAPVETVLAVLRPGDRLSRTVPLPADWISVADVQRAFASPGSDS
ncbi:hypothetical protein GCM10023328_16240 [Modestobacter marinus]|uniref:Nitrate reductase n=1 Tax=Modestobacter marinus TaxID=477641 RepID=A0A846LR40_9ACTN|nr:hypothetical protein [Modestobacter marinus]NIH68740.1 hypothetical protein [Modestobacter marinus]NIH68742.1 hypothetical protein [Modestobacter marinus]GGL59723.1 hypothetical protein GCM10011589_14630 [Modestobacter marinus]